MSTAQRIIKNTGFLYIKMGITVFISLYTTRLILESLGASDFGIFNVVGGAIGMLGFLNSTLANATQRFMSYAEGEGNADNKIKIFNVSIILHFFIAVITVLLLIGIIPILFGSILNILKYFSAVPSWERQMLSLAFPAAPWPSSSGSIRSFSTPSKLS